MLDLFRSRRRRWVVMGTLWLVWTVGLAGQDQASEKCVFEGIARDKVKQLPVAKVSIKLFPKSGRVGYSGVSNDAGGFCFQGVEAGDYSLGVERSGYSAGAVLTSKSGRPVGLLHLGGGQIVAATEMWLTPESGIRGRVLGPDGEAIAGAFVTLIARRWKHGKRVYQAADNGETNHAGEYRFHGVAPGSYFVYATRPSSGPLALSILEAPGKPERRITGRYHPNATQLDDAAPLEVRAGEELSGIDFRLPLSPVFHARGSADSSAARDTGVVLRKRYGEQALEWDGLFASIREDGSFDIAGVTPGSYVLYSLQSIQHAQLESVKAPVMLRSQDTTGLVAPGVIRVQVRGRVRVEDGSGAKAPAVQIFLEGSEIDRSTLCEDDGTFIFKDLTPDRYSMRIVDTWKEPELYLKSIRVDGVAIEGDEVDVNGGATGDVELILSSGAGRGRGHGQMAGRRVGAGCRIDGCGNSGERPAHGRHGGDRAVGPDRPVSHGRSGAGAISRLRVDPIRQGIVAGAGVSAPCGEPGSGV